MKLTGLPVYLVAICLSLYLLTLTFLNLINILSKLNSTTQVKIDMYKVCIDSFYNDKAYETDKPMRYFLSSDRNIHRNCLQILTN